MLSRLLVVFIGGGLGATCRFGTALLTARWLGARFAWSTLVVNLAGCLMIGVAFGLIERGWPHAPAFRLFFITGFLGGLTTFSTFAWESVAGTPGLAIVNILANNVGGILLVCLGLFLAKTLH
jgi:CrcB protein